MQYLHSCISMAASSHRKPVIVSKVKLLLIQCCPFIQPCCKIL